MSNTEDDFESVEAQVEENSLLTNEIDRENHLYKPSTIRSIKNKEKADKKRYYVDKAAFYDALVERHKQIIANEAQGLPKPRITDFIGDCIVKIATNMSKKHNFSGYHYKDEMVGNAVEHCLRAIDKFDITKSNNPFSYFTQACFFVFIDEIKNEKKELYIRCRSTLDRAAFGSLSEVTEESDAIAEHLHDNFLFKTDFVEQFVDDYENKMGIKRGDKKEKPAKKSSLDELMED